MKLGNQLATLAMLCIAAQSWSFEVPTAGTALPVSSTDYPNEVSYNRHIRPILADNCFGCHGGTLSIARGELLLNNFESATGALGGPTALVPGDSGASELVKRLFSEDPEYVMPPPEAQKTLNLAQKNALVRWIDQGAVYEKHWAYDVPRRPAIPEQGFELPVDNFLAESLREVKLQFALQANADTLVRRLYLDLLGLPPTAEQREEGVALIAAGLYSQLVESLLSSPHFGERMAVNWLDWVRYADSVGYQSDNIRSVYPYRDYVIEAFNSNKPFDDFTREQLAGDLLAEEPTQEQLIASGYNMLAMVSEEGGIQEAEYLARYTSDRIANVSATWLGATLECAQCHDHKFDPFLARDYYSLGAFFGDIEEEFRYIPAYWPWMDVHNKGYEATLAALQAEREDIQQRLLERSSVFQRERLWMDLAAQPDLLQWHPMRALAAQLGECAQPHINKRGDVENRERCRDTAIYTAEFDPGTVEPISGLRMRIRPPSDFKQIAVADNRIIISEIEAFEVSGSGEMLRSLPLVRGESLVSSRISPAQFAVDGDEATSWRILQGNSLFLGSASLSLVAEYDFLKPYFFADFARLVSKLPRSLQDSVWSGLEENLAAAVAETGIVPPPADAPREVLREDADELRAFVHGGTYVSAVFHFKAPVPLLPGARIRIRIKHMNPANAVVRFAFDRTQAPLAYPRFEQLQSSETLLDDYLVLAAAQDQALIARRDRLQQEIDRMRSFRPNTWVVRQRQEPRSHRVLPRGDWRDQSGPLVSPAIPEVFGHIEPRMGERPDRLDLANWIVSSENPLTSRVIVNRLWAILFGEGIVRTQQDLGTQGDWPSHQALLDWLAVEFRESGWNVKGLLRQLLLSRAYRQQSQASQAALSIDPENRLLSHQNRWRLYAEFIRDHHLAVAGLLEKRIGGWPIRAQQPEHYWKNLRYPERIYNASQGSEQNRRGVYMHTQRTFPHPALKVFGATGRTEHLSQRDRSSSPLQALTLLNSPTFVNAAQHFARRILANGPADWPGRVRWAWLEVYGRSATEGEIQALLAVLTPTDTDIETETGSETDTDTGVEEAMPEESAQALALARALLNSQESITRP